MNFYIHLRQAAKEVDLWKYYNRSCKIWIKCDSPWNQRWDKAVSPIIESRCFPWGYTHMAFSWSCLVNNAVTAAAWLTCCICLSEGKEAGSTRARQGIFHSCWPFMQISSLLYCQCDGCGSRPHEENNWPVVCRKQGILTNVADQAPLRVELLHSGRSKGSYIQCPAS